MPQTAQASPLDIGWQYSRVTDLSGGLYTQLADTVIDDRFTPRCQGVVFHSGIVETDDALTSVDLSEDFEGNPIEGKIQLVFDVSLAQTGIEQFVLTTSTLYVRATLGLQKATFTTGEDIALNGNENIPATWTLLVSAALVVITNGVDLPFTYDGTDVAWIQGLAPRPAPISEAFDADDHLLRSFTAAIVTSWNNLLIFLDTTEQAELDADAIRRRYRVRRSDAGAPAEWKEGIAGKTDLLDLPHNIVGAAPLGQYLIVYRQASLVRAEWIGSARQTIGFNTVVQTDGPLSSRAIAHIDDTHVFIARLGVYLYRGDLFTSLISTPIERDLFYVGGPVDTLDAQDVIAITYVARRTILVFVYNGDDDTTSMYSVYIPYNPELPPRWGLRELQNRKVDVAGTYRLGADPTAISWELFGGNWDGTAEVWSSYQPGSDRYARPILVDRRPGKMAQWYTGIPGSLDNWEYQTRVFGIDDRDIRIDTVLVLFEGPGIHIEAITDRGEHKRSRDYTAGSGLRWARFNWQRTLREVTLRFSNVANAPGPVRIHTYGIRYRQEAEPGTLSTLGAI